MHRHEQEQETGGGLGPAPAATEEPTECCAPTDGAAAPDDGVQSDAQQSKESLKN